MFLLEATEAKESLSIRLTATELLVKGHGVLGVTSLKDVAAIVVGNVHVHGAFLLETLPAVGLKNLSLEVSVITTSILLIVEDVLEVRAAIAILDNLGHVQTLSN